MTPVDVITLVGRGITYGIALAVLIGAPVLLVTLLVLAIRDARGRDVGCWADDDACAAPVVHLPCTAFMYDETIIPEGVTARDYRRRNNVVAFNGRRSTWPPRRPWGGDAA